MRIGVPREVKEDEYRVALTPASIDELARRGHDVVVEAGAGEGAGYADEAYVRAGAEIGDTEAAWSAGLVVKVKEPQLAELAFLREDQVLFTYLHLAANPGVADALLRAGTTAIAYETVEREDGSLPLLAPMSEVAGRLVVQGGARHLEAPSGGRGVLLGGVAGVSPGSVVVLGGGIVGLNAALTALGLQAHVAVLDIDLDRLRFLETILLGRVTLLHSTRLAIEELLPSADLVIGAVLVPGARAPVLIDLDAVSLMRAGSVIADVAVDQGGCVATTVPTTHSDPTYVVDGVVHYAVANLPGAVPVTATRALAAATLPYVAALADEGTAEAVRHHADLAAGVNARDGKIVNPAVAEALGA